MAACHQQDHPTECADDPEEADLAGTWDAELIPRGRPHRPRSSSHSSPLFSLCRPSRFSAVRHGECLAGSAVGLGGQ